MLSHSAIPIALALLGVVSVAYGVMVALVRSGTAFHLVWIGLGAALLLAAWLVWSGAWSRLPAMLRTAAVAVAGAAFVVLAVSAGFAASGMGAAASPDLDYIVVLGAQVKPEGPSTVLRFRLDAALEYLRRNPATKVVVSGGQGPNEPWAEARGMADYLLARGVDPARVIEEGSSTTTRENLLESLALIEADGGGAQTSRIGIVTNGFHVFRAVATARKLGYARVEGIAAGSVPAYLPNNLLRESIGLVKDLLAGNV